MSPHTLDDKIGSWSIEKLNLLRKYLSAYIKVLKNQDWCRGFEYIDAFAGTGKPRTRDEQRYIDGSPRVALSLSPWFTRYHFIEQSDWRVVRLQRLRADFPDRAVTIYHGDSNKVIREQILPQLSYKMRRRAIAFVDPFGMQMEWKTMQDLAKTNTIEIILNFPIMAINRGILRRYPEKISETKRDRMNRFWGTNDWMVDLYEEERLLFGTQKIKKRISGKGIGTLFKKRLQEIFPNCTTPVLMTNSKNAPLYCVMFAGHNSTGKKIAQGIFSKYERGKV